MFWKTAKLLGIAFLLSACQPTVHKQETVVFGTHVSITLLHDNQQQAQAALDEVFSRFAEMHRRFHAWQDGELFQLNRNIAAAALPQRLSPSMRAMIEQGKEYSAYSEGCFNPAIGALVRLWGFHADELPETPPVPPEAAAINALLAGGGSDMTAVTLQGDFLQSAPAGLQLDFGALAKGVALDEAGAIIRKHGIADALINIGGNIMALGRNFDKPWKVALAPDRRAEPIAIVELYDGEAVATSGVSERFFLHNGKRYHHIIDPRTGYPAAAIHSAAIAISSGENAGASSDAAATALVIADRATAARILPRFNITLAWQQNGLVTAAMRERFATGASGNTRAAVADRIESL